MICTFTEYYSGHQIKRNEMEGACGTYGGEKRRIHSFDGEIQGKETTWKT